MIKQSKPRQLDTRRLADAFIHYYSLPQSPFPGMFMRYSNMADLTDFSVLPDIALLLATLSAWRGYVPPEYLR